MQNTNVQTFQTWAVVSDEITNNGIMTLSLPATLANSMLAFEFYNGNTPITTNTTSGSLAITGKYKNGRNRSVATIDLANVNEYPVLGLYSSLTFSLTNLAGCNRVVIYAVQYANIVPSGADGGATSLVVTSPNSSVAQMGSSTYDPVLKKLTVALEAVGDGGMANPMTSVDDIIVGGIAGAPQRLPKGKPGQALTVDSLGAVKYDTVSNTKYDFIVTGDNTPTFAAGEEYILYPNNISGYVEFELTFLSQYKTGATSYGEVTAKFSIDHNSGTGFNNAAIKLLSLCQSSESGQNLTNLFTFTSYQTTAPYTINGVTIPTNQIIYTIKLNNALTYNGTNSIYAKVSSNATSAYNAMNGSLAPAVLGIVSTPIPALAMTEEGEEEIVGATTVIKADNALFQSSLDPNNFVTNLITGLTQVKPYFSKYKYTDPVAGLDTNNGSYNAPYKTMLYSVTNNPTGTIHVLMGQSTEPAFSIPADKTNIDIIAQGTRSALNGFTNKVTVLGTGAGSVRFQDLNFGGGLTRAATCTCGIYVYDGSIGSAGFTNSGNGYTEISQTDASNGVNNISAGTTVFYGGKVSAPLMTGAGTVVTFDNVGTVNGNTAIASAGATLYMFETNWAAAASGHAILCATGTVITMQGCNFVRPNGTLASISVANYDIQNTDFDKANSVLGTHIGNYDWYAKLGLLNADTVTTAKKMLVRKVTGEIAEQVIPVIDQSYQFNVPAGTLYCEDDNMIPQVMAMRNSLGEIQDKQKALVATGNALSQVDQVFSLSYNAGQTLVLSGEVSIYNNVAITSENYIATAQVIGRTITGQLVNLGTSTQVAMLKAAYAYNSIPFSCTHTTGTSMVAIGVRVTIQYPQINDTAIVDTLFIRATVS